MPIEPASAVLKGGESRRFVLKDAQGNGTPAKWSIDPADVGVIGDDGVYVAPGLVWESADVKVAATATDTTVSRAVVTLAPAIAITPAKVELGDGQVQQFVANPADSVAWQIAPELGHIDPVSGTYTAPPRITDGCTITIFASNTATQGMARLSLKTGPTSTFSNVVTGLYLLAILVVVVCFLIALWPTAGNVNIPALDAAIAQQEASVKTAQAAGDQAASQLAIARMNLKAAQEEREKAEKVATSVGTFWRETDLFWIALLCGALGSFVHIARSYVDYVGNRMVRASWRAWYLLYPFIGGALALIFYLVIRAGFFSTSSKPSDVSPYGIAAISALCGMFTKQATNKLNEVFCTLFKTDDDKKLKDKLGSIKTNPPSVSQ